MSISPPVAVSIFSSVTSTGSLAKDRKSSTSDWAFFCAAMGLTGSLLAFSCCFCDDVKGDRMKLITRRSFDGLLVAPSNEEDADDEDNEKPPRSGRPSGRRAPFIDTTEELRRTRSFDRRLAINREDGTCAGANGSTAVGR